MDISTEELQSQLELLNFEMLMVKRFGIEDPCLFTW